jgi:hypothetical protein
MYEDQSVSVLGNLIGPCKRAFRGDETGLLYLKQFRTMHVHVRHVSIAGDARHGRSKEDKKMFQKNVDEVERGKCER